MHTIDLIVNVMMICMLYSSINYGVFTPHSTLVTYNTTTEDLLTRIQRRTQTCDALWRHHIHTYNISDVIAVYTSQVNTI